MNFKSWFKERYNMYLYEAQTSKVVEFLKLESEQAEFYINEQKEYGETFFYKIDFYKSIASTIIENHCLDCFENGY